jgi:hypothetical protein
MLVVVKAPGASWAFPLAVSAALMFAISVTPLESPDGGIPDVRT